MKNLLLSSFACLLLVTTGCDKEDDVNTEITPATVSAVLKSGSWKVSYFYDTDHEETNHFTGYNFTFNNDGTVSASNDILTRGGTWSTDIDDGKTELDLNFAAPDDFIEISEDWTVIERTTTTIKLEHVSGGGGGTDQLTFQKN